MKLPFWACVWEETVIKNFFVSSNCCYYIQTISSLLENMTDRKILYGDFSSSLQKIDIFPLDLQFLFASFAMHDKEFLPFCLCSASTPCNSRLYPGQFFFFSYEVLKGAAVETFRVLAQKLVATMVSPSSWKLYVTANDGKMNNLGKVANPIINQVTPEERGCTASKNLGKNVEKMEKHFHEAENRYHSGNDFNRGEKKHFSYSIPELKLTFKWTTNVLLKHVFVLENCKIIFLGRKSHLPYDVGLCLLPKRRWSQLPVEMEPFLLMQFFKLDKQHR